MEFRRTRIVPGGWFNPWTFALGCWLAFTAVVWEEAWWPFRILLALFAVLAAGGALASVRPRSFEVAVDDEGIDWGGSRKLGMGDVRKVLHDPSRRTVYLELRETVAKGICGPGTATLRLDLLAIDAAAFVDHMRVHHPAVPIEEVNGVIFHSTG